MSLWGVPKLEEVFSFFSITLWKLSRNIFPFVPDAQQSSSFSGLMDSWIWQVLQDILLTVHIRNSSPPPRLAAMDFDDLEEAEGQEGPKLVELRKLRSPATWYWRAKVLWET